MSVELIIQGKQSRGFGIDYAGQTAPVCGIDYPG